MKITEIRLGSISVPLRVPFKTALRTVTSVEDIILEIHTDTGAVGYGEAPLNGGIRLVSRWAKLDYANSDVNKNGWYHFNSHGIMDFGWFKDEQGNWYYCNTAHDGWLGKMQTGWHFDEVDKHWYYLDPATGMMLTGWQEIGGKWYYFTPTTTAYTYEYDAVNEKWFYKTNNTVRPHGSMYEGETTPDGYHVDRSGAWQR